MFAIVKILGRRDEGVTAIEYGLIASLIAVAIIATAQALGIYVSNTFARVSTALTGA